MHSGKQLLFQDGTMRGTYGYSREMNLLYLQFTGWHLYLLVYPTCLHNLVYYKILKNLVTQNSTFVFVRLNYVKVFEIFF